MNKKTTYILGLLLTIIFGTLLYYNLCCSSLDVDGVMPDETETVVVEEVIAPATKNKFSMEDNKSGVSFSAMSNFNFAHSKAQILQPVSEGLKHELDRLSGFLNENPRKVAEITGFYRDDEINNTAFPNLGLARAHAVKSYCMSQGVSSRSINAYGELNAEMIPDQDGTFFGPLRYRVSTIAENDTSLQDELKALETEIKTNPLVMYFDIGDTSINLSKSQREKVAKIARYIDKSENAKLHIIGHTDNTGDRKSNIELALKRAGFIKEYFVDNAISDTKIETSSKGPDAPIASNDTDEGRAKNRRVVVTIN
ncbi:OmpA family protein [Bizionia paragorgiae]|uniref:OmpA family protein n=1 Tax=Bizionia paragorgiae TaxID=283786 RepID=A0A1H3Z0J9_BIZPA|nr:OmpA family protein [Bizionia paragorgiae]MDX1272354.1 OmpA family protein [Bizionia paragorgiae]SEA16971.1 OmpA family protein [Bizionia paragorgiae]